MLGQCATFDSELDHSIVSGGKVFQGWCVPDIINKAPQHAAKICSHVILRMKAEKALKMDALGSYDLLTLATRFPKLNNHIKVSCMQFNAHISEEY